ncbi:hypothetical protein [Helicobacter sp. MIT 11-5569]|uniref:hypothetical protein n=1 Tax=Helicobacter sp. MIT 11-5569 TaxID=1548151 RepID=UPI001912A570|nr:hypothetical protein [Helicobacter sp. MIT 11-5569]
MLKTNKILKLRRKVRIFLPKNFEAIPKQIPKKQNNAKKLKKDKEEKAFMGFIPCQGLNFILKIFIIKNISKSQKMLRIKTKNNPIMFAQLSSFVSHFIFMFSIFIP